MTDSNKQHNQEEDKRLHRVKCDFGSLDYYKYFIKKTGNDHISGIKFGEVLREFKDKVMHRLEVMNVAPSESARHIGGLEDERDKASALILYYKRCDTLLASLPVVLNFINGLLQTLKNIEYRYNKCVQLKNDKDLSPEVMDFVEATERFYNLEIGGSGPVHGFITDIREDVNKIYEYLLSISNVTYITRPVYRRRAEEILRDINSDTSVSQQGGVLGDEGDTTMEDSGSFDGFVLNIFGDDIVDGEENANMINLGDTINDNFLAAMAEEAALEQGDDILDDFTKDASHIKNRMDEAKYLKVSIVRESSDLCLPGIFNEPQLN